MIYLRLFEDFNQHILYPDVFNRKRVRGVRLDVDEYIDDPINRVVSIGDATRSGRPDYYAYLNNLEKLGIPNPTKSIHMYFRPNSDKIFDRYGRRYDVFPKKIDQDGNPTKFGFCKKVLGDTYFFPSENLIHIKNTPKDWLEKKDLVFFSKNYNQDGEYILDKKFIEEITEYQKILIENGMIGVMTYNELVELSSKDGEPIQIWTNSPCYHKAIAKESRKPKEYKNEPLINKNDLIENGINPKDIAAFFKDNSKNIRDIQNTDYDFDTKRKMALDLIYKII
jgi:hypothetical protein